MKRQKLGRLGENLAARYLQNKHYKLLERNFVYLDNNGVKLAELDLVAKDGSCLVFVEVKTSLDNLANADFEPEDRVNYAKGRRLARAGQYWLAKHNLQNLDWRIDVVALKLDPLKRKARVKHLVDIFGL